MTKKIKNQFGDYVLNGAMSVLKVKNGQNVQRFIWCFGPLNFYMRLSEGDAKTLPQAAFISKFIFTPDELLCIDGEDFQSCFN